MVVLSDGGFAANVRVEARNDETGRVWSTWSSGFGYYSLTLPAGLYRVSVPVKLPLRPKFVVVEIVAGRETLYDVPMELYAEVDVHVDAGTEGFTPLPRFVFDDASLGSKFSRAELERMPLSHGRTIQSLLALVPGIVFTDSVGTLAQFTAAGQRRFANRLTIDGVSADLAVDVRGHGIGEAGSGALPALATSGGTQTLVPLAAVEEIEIRTSNAAPEHARTPGAQTSIVTRAGNDRFTGATFIDWRPTRLAAQDWFSNAGEAPKRDISLTNSGASSGGPLMPRRMFYFAAWEQQRISRAAHATFRVPSQSTRDQAPDDLRAVLEAFPRPNGADVGSGWAEYSDKVPAESRLWDLSVRVDANLTARHRIFTRINRGVSSGDALGLTYQLPFYSFDDAQKTSTTSATFGMTSILASSAVNELRVNATSHHGSDVREPASYGQARSLPSWLAPVSDDAIAEVNFAAGSGTFISLGPTGSSEQHQAQIVDTATLVRAGHEWRFGVDYRRADVATTSASRSFLYRFNAAAGLPKATPRFVNLQYTRPARARLETVALFAQDVFRLSPRLSVNYGARYSIKPAPSNLTDAAPLLVELDALPAVVPRQDGGPLWNTSKSNIGSRAGVAYELSTASGRETTLRAGWNLIYDEMTNPGASAFGSAFPYVATRTLRPRVFPVPEADLLQPPPETFASADGAEAYAFPRNLRTPRTSAWNVSIGQALGQAQRVSVSYVGAASRHLPYWSADYIGDQTHVVNSISSDARSDYHGLLTEYVRRLSHGVEARAAYAWSRTVDTDSGESVLAHPPVRFVPIASNRGPADFDRRHMLQAAASIRPGAGLQIDVVGTYISGAPMTPYIYAALPGATGVYGMRPDLVTRTPLWVDDASVPMGRRLNAAAFAPPAGLQGNIGRNELRASPLRQVDLAVSRSLRVKRTVLQARLDVLNALNIANFGPSYMDLTTPSSFGRAFSSYAQGLGTGTLGLGGLSPIQQSGGPRAVQFSVRLAFY